MMRRLPHSSHGISIQFEEDVVGGGCVEGETTFSLYSVVRPSFSCEMCCIKRVSCHLYSFEGEVKCEGSRSGEQRVVEMVHVVSGVQSTRINIQASE